MSSNFPEQSVGVSTQISRIVADLRPQAAASAVRTPHICDSDTLPPTHTQPGQLNSRAITCRPTWLNGG